MAGSIWSDENNVQSLIMYTELGIPAKDIAKLFDIRVEAVYNKRSQLIKAGRLAPQKCGRRKRKDVNQMELPLVKEVKPAVSPVVITTNKTLPSDQIMWAGVGFSVGVFLTALTYFII